MERMIDIDARRNFKRRRSIVALKYRTETPTQCLILRKCLIHNITPPWFFKYLCRQGDFPKVLVINEFKEPSVSVKITWATNPSHLCVNLVRNRALLRNMQRRLNNHYRLFEQFYRMDEFAIRFKTLCACEYRRNGITVWRRAAIATKDFDPAQDSVKIAYIDSGICRDVNKRNLRYLNKEFLELPAQAISIQLGFIKPKDEGWPVRSGDLLMQLANNRTFQLHTYRFNSFSTKCFHFLLNGNVFYNTEVVEFGIGRYMTPEELYEAGAPVITCEPQNVQAKITLSYN